MGDRETAACLFLALVLAEAREYVLERCTLDLETGCWNWAQSTDGRYGQAYIFGFKFKSHWLAAVAWGHRFLRHHVTAHRCNNTLCCNPNHLEPVSQSENIKQCWRDGRLRSPFVKGND